MTTSYTSLLGLALPVQGELTGTWGTTVNNYITQYLDAAVAGAQTISGSQTAVTLSVANGVSLSQAASAATGSSQYAIINCTGNPASLLTITAPAASKVYLVINATSTNQSVKVVGVGPTTGVTIAANRAALIAWNGSDFRLVATTDASQLSGILPVANGGTGLSSGTSGGVPYFSGSTTMASSAVLAANWILVGGGTGFPPAATPTGSGVVTALGVNVGNVGSFVVNGGALGTPSSATLTSATGLPLSTGVTGTLATTNGGTGLSSFTANQVFYASSTSAVAQSANMQFNGTTFTLANDAVISTHTIGRGGGSSLTNLAVGGGALYNNSVGVGGLGQGQTAVGYRALSNMLGKNNTALGSDAMYASILPINNTGEDNTAVGYRSGYQISSAFYLTSVGSEAAYGATTASYLTALGYRAAYSNTSGSYNTAIGAEALYRNITTSYQTAIGYQAMYNMRGGTNTALGNQAMYGSGTPANNTGTYNVAVGSQALYVVTSGGYNVAVGTESLYSLTSGSSNVAVGYAALFNNQSDNNNTALGYGALVNMRASDNTGVGYRALAGSGTPSNNTGYSNTAVGEQALHVVTSGYSNTAIGHSALSSLSTGANNTVIGYGSGSAITTGSSNVVIGGYTGNNGGLDIRTASNYIVLSDGAGNPRAYWNGANATFAGDLAVNGSVTVGDASGDALTINASTVSTPNGLNFDSNTLVIDAANNRVGIGTASPAERLHVTGSSGITTIRAESTSNTAAQYPLIEFRRTTTSASTTQLVGNLHWQYTLTDATSVTAAQIYISADNNVGSATGNLYINTRTTQIFQILSAERARITSAGNQMLYQPAESAQNTSATLSVAQLQTRIITSNAAVTLTLPTGTTLETYSSTPTMAVDSSFEVTFIATTANAITIAANGNTTVGSLTVNGNSSGVFRFRKTASNTFTVYRIA